MMENKARDAEMMVTRLVEEAERRREEADVLKKEVESARWIYTPYVCFMYVFFTYRINLMPLRICIVTWTTI